MLMVRHVHDGRDYWTFPGGGIEAGESVFEAAKREVLEETNLDLDPLDLIHSFESDENETHCVLMQPPQMLIPPKLGGDPEEEGLPPEERMLRDVAWRLVIEVNHHPIIARVLVEAESRRRKTCD